MRNYGIGHKVTRSIWHSPDTFWQVTRIKLKPGEAGEALHGKIWGVFHWKGVPKGGEAEIRSPLKKQWLLVEEGQGSIKEGAAAKPAPPQQQAA